MKGSEGFCKLKKNGDGFDTGITDKCVHPLSDVFCDVVGVIPRIKYRVMCFFNSTWFCSDCSEIRKYFNDVVCVSR